MLVSPAYREAAELEECSEKAPCTLEVSPNFMRIQAVDSAEFFEVAGTALCDGGAEELGRRVGPRWTPEQLCQILQDDSSDVRKLACTALALCGDERAAGCLTAALRDDDHHVAELAEQALWSIWFRGGSAAARKEFCRGLRATGAGDYDQAVRLFRSAQDADPGFAEACNQCAIAHYLQEQWVDSIEQSELALDLNAVHFGAMSGLGHCHFQLGNFAEASRWYRRALAINPRMHSIAAALRRISRCVAAV